MYVLLIRLLKTRRWYSLKALRVPTSRVFLHATTGSSTALAQSGLFRRADTTLNARFLRQPLPRTDVVFSNQLFSYQYIGKRRKILSETRRASFAFPRCESSVLLSTTILKHFSTWKTRKGVLKMGKIEWLLCLCYSCDMGYIHNDNGLCSTLAFFTLGTSRWNSFFV